MDNNTDNNSSSQEMPLIANSISTYAFYDAAGFYIKEIPFSTNEIECYKPYK